MCFAIYLASGKPIVSAEDRSAHVPLRVEPCPVPGGPPIDDTPAYWSEFRTRTEDCCCDLFPDDEHAEADNAAEAERMHKAEAERLRLMTALSALVSGIGRGSVLMTCWHGWNDAVVSELQEVWLEDLATLRLDSQPHAPKLYRVR